MAGSIYRKPVMFSVVALLVILAGTVATMFYPMLREDMHPRLPTLRPFTPLELAGRDVYQREGCMGCHTQTVRPLKSEVARYGDYSKAGEFAFDHPHLWGSKRTGPDLARVGGKYNDAWHRDHLKDPRAVVPRSNMPAYAFLETAALDPAAVRSHYRALARLYPPADFPASDADFQELSRRTELDALVAYLQWLGHAVARRAAFPVELAAVNPLPADARTLQAGHVVFAENCAMCHGDEGEGGAGPSLVDAQFLAEPGDLPDGAYFALISYGSDVKPQLGRSGDPQGGMQAFAGQLSKEQIWSVIRYLRSRQQHEQAEHP